ncbi:MAG: Ig-like domain repeat protein [Methanobrevibacter sp.]|uniref:Ig-like domain repeat protein n=1 Tax=Methanobrevibacter sp. TaxID=66852 RepID=UPI0026DFA7E3|nr:Ig-like domain repeat protein [Methanobrevibacter sp.]MDO5848694.1 Ig-like domain repeat protein [Methanobrevibacter sp.]
MNKKMCALSFLLICILFISVASAEDADSFSSLNNTISSATDDVDLSTDYLRDDADSINAINISKDIVINGNGKTIDGNGKGPIFTIDKGATVTINDITFINGNGDCGGAIANYGTLFLNNCKFLNNTATSKGGAVYNNGILTVSNSEFINSTATYYGGAISNDGILDVDKSVFKGNNITYRVSAGLTGDAYAAGAAIFNSNVTSIRNSEIRDNAEDYINGHIMYGAVSSSGNLTVVNTRFDNNYGRYGGAIAAFDYKKSSAKVEIVNCTFENNTSIYGGAAYVNGPTAVIIGCNFTGNKGTGKGDVSPNNNNGGALAVFGGSSALISDCRFISNSAHYGGAISIGENNGITINNCIFQYNNATKSGGAIEISSTATAGYSNVVNINNSTFDVNNAVSPGGAIYSVKPFILNVDKCTFINSSSKNYGGAIYTVGATATIMNSLFLDNMGSQGRDIYYTRPAATIKNITSNSKGVASSLTTIIYKNINFITEMTLDDVSVEYNDENIVIFISGSVKTGNSNTYVTVTMGNFTETIKVTGNNFNPGKFSGNITIPKDEVEYGLHNILVTFPEQGTLTSTGHWYACEANTTALIELIDTKIVLDSIENYTDDGRAIIIKGNTSSIANGTNITVTVNGEERNVTVTDDKFSLDLGVLNTGIYKVTAKYDGNLRYSDAEDSISFTNFIKTSVTLNPIANVSYGNSVVISGSTTNISNGSSISIKVGDKVYEAIVDKNGNFNYAIDDIEAGDYSVEAKFEGNETHAPSSADSQFSVTKANSTVSVSVDNITFGDRVSGVVSLGNGLDGNVTVTINDKDYEISVADGNGVIDEVISLDAGNYDVVVSFAGNDNYNPSSNTTSFAVAKANSTVSVSVGNIILGNAAIVNVTLNSIDGTPLSGKVFVSVNGDAYEVDVTDGKGTLPIEGLEIGNYAVDATFEGNENYLGSQNSTEFEVIEPSCYLESQDVVKYYKNGTQYNVKVLYENGNPASGKVVDVYLNGKSFKDLKYSIVSGEDGVATLAINLAPGDYSITAVMADQEVKNSITVLPMTYELFAEDIDMTFKDGTSYNVTVLDADGNPTAGKTVALTISSPKWTKSATYNIVTDEDGVASLPINLAIGSYGFMASFDGESVKTQVNVLKAAYKLESADVVKYYKNGTQYHVTVKDLNGNAVAGKTVAITLGASSWKNPAKYNIVTDDNGVATLDINLVAGTYTISADVDGNVAQNYIEVLPVITSESVSKPANQPGSVSAKLVNEQGKPAAGQVVSFTIKFPTKTVTYYKITDTDGLASLPINLCPGTYAVTITTPNGAQTQTTVKVTA